MTSCKKSFYAVLDFWSLPKLPAQTSYAAPQLQRTCRTDSVSCWQKQHRALSNTLLRIRLSCVGKISRQALHEKILILFGMVAFHSRDQRDPTTLCSKDSPSLNSSFLNCFATKYQDRIVYLPFFAKDHTSTSWTTRLLKGTWSIASASNWWNMAIILSLSQWWFCQSTKSKTCHSQISSFGWNSILLLGGLVASNP